MTNLTLTAQTEYIRKSAFIHCTDLRSVTSLAETPPSLSEEAFSDETFLTATLYVPAGALETYQNASTWKNFYDIRELDLTGITSAAGADETIVSAGNGSISVSGATGWVEVYTTSGNLVGRQRNDEPATAWHLHRKSRRTRLQVERGIKTFLSLQALRGCKKERIILFVQKVSLLLHPANAIDSNETKNKITKAQHDCSTRERRREHRARPQEV